MFNNYNTNVLNCQISIILPLVFLLKILKFNIKCLVVNLLFIDCCAA